MSMAHSADTLQRMRDMLNTPQGQAAVGPLLAETMRARGLTTQEDMEGLKGELLTSMLYHIAQQIPEVYDNLRDDVWAILRAQG